MKSSVRWLLFEYEGLELVILSKPFKTKKLAEKARLKYPDRVRRKIGIGVVRVAKPVAKGLVEKKYQGDRSLLQYRVSCIDP